jgi:UPF0755 protein
MIKIAGVKILGLLFVIAVLVGVYGYLKIFGSNTQFSNDSKELKIPSGSGYSEVKDILQNEGIISDMSSFSMVAGLMKYKKDQVPPGRYLIKKGASNRQIIAKLRSGDQDPIKVTINNVRTIPELAGVLGKYFEKDSLTMLEYLSDNSVQSKFGKNPQTMMTSFLADTYEMFWTDSPEKIVKRLSEYTTKFFDGKKAQLSKIGLSVEQAYTLASIVDKESNYAPEKPTIAGVYLNRLSRGERLAADPTVVFALQDFTIRRVLNIHLAYDSPYNTYMYTGLPPGPICLPEMSSINAVLAPQQHEYLFFCAKPGYGSEHAFAKTYDQHLANARTYQAWLETEGIR